MKRLKTITVIAAILIAAGFLVQCGEPADLLSSVEKAVEEAAHDGRPPEAPSALTAVALDSDRIELSWVDNSDNEKSFELERKTGSDGVYKPVDGSPLSADNTTYIAENLDSQTTYYFQVRAVNGAGASNWDGATAQTPILSTPESLEATVSFGPVVELTWVDLSAGESSFEIQVSEGGGPWGTVEMAEGDTASYEDIERDSHTDYAYRVRAVDSGGVSGWSGTASVTTTIPLYIADWEGKATEIIDVSNPSDPQLLGSYPYGGLAVWVTDSVAYVSGSSMTGTMIADVSDPTTPTTIKNISRSSVDVAVAGEYAYLLSSSDADGFAIVTVYDVSDPSNPSYAATESLDDGSIIVLDSGYAYVAGCTHGLYVLDIASGGSVSFKGNCDTVGDAIDVAIAQPYAYVADGSDSGGLHIVDVSNAENPQNIASVTTVGAIWGVAVVGDYAFITEYDTGLHVVDVSDPDTPVIVETLTFPAASYYGLSVKGEYAFVGADNCLYIIDISDPENLIVVGTYQDEDEPIRPLYSFIE